MLIFYEIYNLFIIKKNLFFLIIFTLLDCGNINLESVILSRGALDDVNAGIS